MSSAVTRRLQEMAERGEERRRRVAHIRRQSSLVADAVHQLRLPRDQRAVWHPLECPSSGVSMETPEENDLGEAAAPAGGDVLGQVRQLLLEIDGRERDTWNEDDTLILICLQGALAAAARKGYPLQNLQAILEALRPPGMDT